MNKISVIIITYQRDEDLIEAVDSSRQALGELLGEIVVVDNNEDGKDRSELFLNFQNVNVVTPGKNLGVAGGRNYGVRVSRFPYLLFFDDDAVFSESFDLNQFQQSLKPDVMLASNAIRSSGDYAREEFPFFDKSRSRDVDQACCRFIGVAHACHRELYDQFGGYDEQTFYGMEEFYFSAWLLAKGYELTYLSSFKVVHKKTDAGRSDWDVQVVRMFRNKLGFLKQWYPLPIYWLLMLINLVFFHRQGLSLSSAFKVVFDIGLLRKKDIVDISFFDRCKFISAQWRIGDYLL